MTFYIFQNMEYTTDHTALNTVSHNAMDLTLPYISSVTNKPEVIAYQPGSCNISFLSHFVNRQLNIMTFLHKFGLYVKLRSCDILLFEMFECSMFHIPF